MLCLPDRKEDVAGDSEPCTRTVRLQCLRQLRCSTCLLRGRSWAPGRLRRPSSAQRVRPHVRGGRRIRPRTADSAAPLPPPRVVPVGRTGVPGASRSAPLPAGPSWHLQAPRTPSQARSRGTVTRHPNGASAYSQARPREAGPGGGARGETEAGLRRPHPHPAPGPSRPPRVTCRTRACAAPGGKPIRSDGWRSRR